MQAKLRIIIVFQKGSCFLFLIQSARGSDRQQKWFVYVIVYHPFIVGMAVAFNPDQI